MIYGNPPRNLSCGVQRVGSATYSMYIYALSIHELIWRTWSSNERDTAAAVSAVCVHGPRANFLYWDREPPREEMAHYTPILHVI
jgi:hypothetical protein